MRFIVPLAPGGAIDFIARAVGEVMSRQIGQQIVVENRTGAGGTLGMDLALKSPPDGYTVLITNDNAASAPHVMNLSYDYTKELLPVIHLGRQAQFLATHASLGVNSVAELVNHVKANPGMGYATSGVGSNQHVLGEWFKREAGIKLDHVPYRGAGPGDQRSDRRACEDRIPRTDRARPALQCRHAALLAQSAATRAPTLPEVPTLEEAGYKGMVLEAWYAAFVPPGTPPALIARLNAEMTQGAQGPQAARDLHQGRGRGCRRQPRGVGKLAQRGFGEICAAGEGTRHQDELEDKRGLYVNKTWHAANRMPEKATREQRVRWHVGACAGLRLPRCSAKPAQGRRAGPADAQCHSASSTVMSSGPRRKTILRLWNCMTSLRSFTPAAVSLATSASRSSTAKQMWLNPSL